MERKTKSPKIFRFIILIPHRDALRPLEDFRAVLFAKGFIGAYAFPAAAPLIEVTQPFSREELKELGRNIRNFTTAKNGKISSIGNGAGGGLGKLSFFGPILNLPAGETLFPASTGDKVLHSFSPPVLCAALVDSDSLEADPLVEIPMPEGVPSLSFRAAALANLAIRSLGEGESRYSFEWKISPPVWLLRHKP